MTEQTQRALAYLERDPLSMMDMLEPVRRGQAEIKGVREDGVIL